MILNIIHVALLYFLTLYLVVVINFIHMLWGDFSKDITNPIFFVTVYGIIILWFCLIYMLYNSVKKKRISKNYMYSYLAFFPLLFIFYFGYYIQYDKLEHIPESIFETRLQNIEVSEDENGLVQLGKLYDDNNKKLKSRLYDLRIKSRKSYDCMIGIYDKKCDSESIEVLIDKYTGWNEIDILNNKIKNIVQYKYFKDTYNHVRTPSSLGTLVRLSLFSTMSYLEKGNENLELILLYKKLGDKLLLGNLDDFGIYNGISIIDKTFKNIDYILNNYDLSNENLSTLKELIDNSYDTEKIVTNAIKVSYQNTKYQIQKGRINSNMLFNKEELLNIDRNIGLKRINGEKYIYKKNYFKRTFVYKILGAYNRGGVVNENKDIENLNIQSKKLLEKIEEQLKN